MVKCRWWEIERVPLGLQVQSYHNPTPSSLQGLCFLWAPNMTDHGGHLGLISTGQIAGVSSDSFYNLFEAAII